MHVLFCKSLVRKDKEDLNIERGYKETEKTTVPFWLNKLSYKNIDIILK